MTDRAMRALELLDAERPQFHPELDVSDGALEDSFKDGPQAAGTPGQRSYAISREVLEFLAESAKPGQISLETGGGYTTVVLAAASGQHVVVNPDTSSNALIEAFCEEHLGGANIRVESGSSDSVLPRLADSDLRIDLALIDGNHSYPFPTVDFHYADQILNSDGLLLLDNTEIRAVDIVVEYLTSEPAYELVRHIRNCAVFRKVGDRSLGWMGQSINQIESGDVAVDRLLTTMAGRMRQTVHYNA